ncbi:MAG: UDP-3-O-(3-hydroxymyristoyl)glucosamine N-acyltransferase [Legionellales bacterium]|nr:UDP-3-O-(3-hydroxymyristoyl)glucosamine N-acyltransferase [Legionellales bacterium]|tara:strand:+ start:449 stop:1504 length:1056 start_codon:yes stop_codon:yes gene_type:complete
MTVLTLHDISQAINGACVNISNLKAPVTRLASLVSATPADISVLSSANYIHAAKQSSCLALVVSKQLSHQFAQDETPMIVVEDAEHAWIALAKLFFRQTRALFEVADCRKSHALIDQSAAIDPSAVIAPGATIGAGATIGSGTVIGANSSIGSGATVGRDCYIYPGVTILDQVLVGDHCSIGSGSVIGSEGFGFFNKDKQWHHIPHLGTVIIQDNVNIGANCSIDRGTLDNTLIEEGAILDNQIHIAHNVTIGQCTALAGGTSIAGSATIGQYCRIGGGCLIAGHLSICDHVDLIGSTSVRKSIDKPGVYGSIFGHILAHAEWARACVHLKNITELAKTMKQKLGFDRAGN